MGSTLSFLSGFVLPDGIEPGFLREFLPNLWLHIGITWEDLKQTISQRLAVNCLEVDEGVEKTMN